MQTARQRDRSNLAASQRRTVYLVQAYRKQVPSRPSTKGSVRLEGPRPVVICPDESQMPS